MLLAVFLGVVRSLAERQPIVEEACILLLGACCTLAMVVIGDAVGRERGALFGAGLGAGMWILLIGAAYEFVPVPFVIIHPPLPTHSLPVQCAAVLLTAAGVAVPCIMRLRSREAPDNEGRTTRRLLQSQKERNRKRRRKTGRDH